VRNIFALIKHQSSHNSDLLSRKEREGGSRKEREGGSRKEREGGSRKEREKQKRERRRKILWDISFVNYSLYCTKCSLYRIKLIEMECFPFKNGNKETISIHIFPEYKPCRRTQVC
jgi:hypothetical protein